MMSPHLTKSLIALLVVLSAASVFAQMAIPYGLPVGVDNAKKAAAAALAEARKNNWTMAFAIVDPSGNLVYYEKMENTQLGSATVAVDKARSAALFKRPTKAFQDALASSVADWDNRHLDLEAEEFRGTPSTGENIVTKLWGKLDYRLAHRLVRLRLWETKNNRFTLRRRCEQADCAKGQAAV